MYNTTIINTFKSDNRNIAYIKTQHRQIMTTITNRNLKLKSMIKKPVLVDNTLFTVITFIFTKIYYSLKSILS